MHDSNTDSEQVFSFDHAVASAVDAGFSGLFGSGFGCFGLGLRVVNRNNNSTYDGMSMAALPSAMGNCHL
jgi:hypothetical protein